LEPLQVGVPQLRRPLRLLDLVPAVALDTASFDYVQEVASTGASGLDSAAETTEGAVKPAAEIIFQDKSAKAEPDAAAE
jgi:hypothetical protein